MTRSEAYAEGFQEGRRWAEADLANGTGEVAYWTEALKDANTSDNPVWRAESLGQARGYRDTVARYEAGTLTRQMFETAPRGGTR